MLHAVIRLLIVTLMLPGLAACAAAPDRSDRGDFESAAAYDAAGHALSMVGKPYRYGGYTPAGFDCSGLVHYSFRRAGLNVPRDTGSLRVTGDAIDRGSLLRGDLVFFDQEGKKSSHVGIYLGDGEFVHAPSSGGRVRVDRIDARYWAKHFDAARRM